MHGAESILVTGADGGMGSAIVHRLLTRPRRRIYAATRNPESGKGNVLFNDERVTILSADLASHADSTSLQKEVIAMSPRIDWIIFTHGYIDTEQNFERQDPKNIDRTFAVNTLSILHLTQLFLPHLAPGAGVISISSTAGVNASGRHPAYSASKAAVNGFMQAMAWNRPEFLFVAVCPGPTNTKMREAVAHDAAKHQDPAIIAEVVERIMNKENAYASGDVIIIKDGVESTVSRIKTS